LTGFLSGVVVARPEKNRKEEKNMRHFCRHARTKTGRRSFLLGTAGAIAAGIATSFGRAEASEAGFDFRHRRKHSREPLPAPKPIPGGTQIPDLPLFHEFLPGPETITLPFTLVTLQGLNVEPSTITDFKGVTVLAYHAGSATGNDGTEYNLETDIRVMQGEYVAENGERREGTFAEM
jgi:hypothetical protein